MFFYYYICGVEERKFAENLYYEDVIKLEKILGRKLLWFTPKN